MGGTGLVKGGAHFFMYGFPALDIHKFTNNRDAGCKIAARTPADPAAGLMNLDASFLHYTCAASFSRFRELKNRSFYGDGIAPDSPSRQ